MRQEAEAEAAKAEVAEGGAEVEAEAKAEVAEGGAEAKAEATEGGAAGEGAGGHVPRGTFTGAPTQKAFRGARAGGKSRWNGIDPIYTVKNQELLKTLVEFYGFDADTFK
eukprot:783311-Prorocentrum_minimum.AAC.1